MPALILLILIHPSLITLILDVLQQIDRFSAFLEAQNDPLRKHLRTTLANSRVSSKELRTILDELHASTLKVFKG
jgi:hypothetical protein